MLHWLNYCSCVRTFLTYFLHKLCCIEADLSQTANLSLLNGPDLEISYDKKRLDVL